MNYAYGRMFSKFIAINKWNHIAVSKSGTNLRLLDGKIVQSAASTIGSSLKWYHIGARKMDTILLKDSSQIFAWSKDLQFIHHSHHQQNHSQQ